MREDPSKQGPASLSFCGACVCAIYVSSLSVFPLTARTWQLLAPLAPVFVVRSRVRRGDTWGAHVRVVCGVLCVCTYVWGESVSESLSYIMAWVHKYKCGLQ